MDIRKTDVWKIFFPNKCPLCGCILGEGELACRDCLKKVRPIGGPRCMKCGAPVRSREREYCDACEKYRHFFTEGFPVFAYRGPVRGAVHRFKYKNRRCYAEFFSEAMLQAGAKKLEKWKPDLVIPIPVHPKKLKSRGFNQADLLARHIAESLGVPFLADGLLRTAATEPQKNLDRKKRQINLKRAFKIGTNDVKLKRILLIDDIYTTGSTVDAAAEVLLANGAAGVWFLTLCAAEGEEHTEE